MIHINKDTTVSFDVDSQNGFTPVCPDELPVPGGDGIVDELNWQATFAKYRIMSKDTHPQKAEWEATKEDPQFTTVGLPNVDIRWNRHCVVGTKGFELIEGLPHPSTYSFLVYKGAERDMHPYSAIYHDLDKRISTGVIEFAHVHKIDTFIIGGLALDYCVKETALDLAKAGFKVIVNLASTRAINNFSQTLKDFDDNYVVVINSIKEFYED